MSAGSEIVWCTPETDAVGAMMLAQYPAISFVTTRLRYATGKERCVAWSTKPNHTT